MKNTIKKNSYPALRCNAWSGGTGKSLTELLRRNPLYLRNPGSIFAHTCFTEINHVSTNGQGRHEESHHASVSGTFPMALMLLNVYVKPFIGKAAYFIWLLAICLHIILIIYFTVKFLLKLQMPKVFRKLFYCICRNCSSICYSPCL